ncbi:MAG TPA: phosphotransferase, partial [Bacillota bacterium]|nr:phosphotransferase [Bacillota bacterium]
NREWIEENVYGDEALRLETAKLKFEFMTNAQSLVHGDLHTGSIFIKEDSMKVIDPEFAFYGPMGFDIGNIVANLMFAWANADAYTVSKQKEWLEETIVAVVDLFKEKYNVLFDENVTEVTARYKGFKEYYLDRILSDTAGVAGLEGSRRIIGIAQVKDITTIEDEAKRIRAERICLTAAKKFIMKRDEFKTGKDFLDVILKTAEQF